MNKDTDAAMRQDGNDILRRLMLDNKVLTFRPMIQVPG